MPSQQTNHHERDDDVEESVGGRDRTLRKKGKGGDLQGISNERNRPCRTVFGLGQRVKVILEL